MKRWWVTFTVDIEAADEPSAIAIARQVVSESKCYRTTRIERYLPCHADVLLEIANSETKP